MEIDRLERAEARWLSRLIARIPEPARSDLGATTTTIAGGVACSMTDDETGYWSKALGFGVESPVDDELLTDIVRFYEAAGAISATLQIAPQHLPADWEALCDEFHLARASTWLKLAGSIHSVNGDSAELRVDVVSDDQSEEWADVMLAGFGMPSAGLKDMLVAGTTDATMHPFAAWSGSDMIAAAGLSIDGDTAELCGAATLPAQRGRGAQPALLAARCRRAGELGATTVTAETAVPHDESEGTSLRNLQAAGLQIVYARPNWTWTREKEAAASAERTV